MEGSEREMMGACVGCLMKMMMCMMMVVMIVGRVFVGTGAG